MRLFLHLKGEAMTLEQKRKDIDEIDREILSLLSQRADIIREIGEIKLRAGLPVIDWGREAEVIRRVAQQCDGSLKNKAADRIYRAILREAREIELDLTRAARELTVPH
jgi:chorismate mutase/prephenate dehydratase